MVAPASAPAHPLAVLGVCLLFLGLAACGDDDDGLPDPAGSYAFDRAVYARALLKESVDGNGSGGPSTDMAARAEALDRANREAARLDMQLVLEGDGSFVVRYRFDKERGRYSGRWTRQRERLTLVTTHAPNGRLATPETIEVRYTAKGVEFPGRTVPRPFFLRRQ